MRGFDYRTATEEEILHRAALLEGMLLGDIPEARFSARHARRGKGEVGLAIETYFGIPPNPVPGADFPGAGIELKVVPLVRSDRRLKVKERTVISLIDYDSIVHETWKTASVRKKLKILFVFFEHLRGRPKRQFPIHSVLLWQPEGEVEDRIHRDWETVREKVERGLAHELSEADGFILGPCTKGASSASLRTQPNSPVRAKSRAFALKPAFTFSLYAEPSAPLTTGQLAEVFDLADLRRRFRRFVGRPIDDVAAELAIRQSRAKDYAARVVHRAVQASSSLPKADFKSIGPTVRMTRVNDDLFPYEALSFPSFRHLELVEETWEDSELLARLEHMLIVPVLGPKRETPVGDCIIQEPVYWRPTAEQLSVIEEEWTMFHDLIAAGRAASLPTESQTRAIHVRPHGKDATDRDPTPGGGSEVRKSFWLNKRLVAALLTAAGTEVGSAQGAP